MTLHTLLAARAAEGRPVRVGLIGAGAFGTLALAQLHRTPGLHLMAIADADPARAHAACAAAGWPEGQAAAGSPAKALRHGTTWITDDAAALVAAGGMEVVIEATGRAEAGLRHAALALEHGRHVVMASLEADVLAGPLLARRFAAAGLVYTLAAGDRPALVCELVDWARACGFAVVAAGTGAAWTPEDAAAVRTRSALEMAAVANATGLGVPREGLAFPPVGRDGLAAMMRPRSAGGVLERAGMVEVVSSLARDGTAVPDALGRAAWVTVEATCDLVARSFATWGLSTDDSGRHAALWRPAPLAGAEVGISVAAAALRGEATGHGAAFLGDVVAVAARDLVLGERLDAGAVAGRLMPAADAVAAGLLPLGLADGVSLARPVRAGRPVPRDAVRLDPDAFAVRLRRELEAAFCAAPPEDEADEPAAR